MIHYITTRKEDRCLFTHEVCLRDPDGKIVRTNTEGWYGVSESVKLWKKEGFRIKDYVDEEEPWRRNLAGRLR